MSSTSMLPKNIVIWTLPRAGSTSVLYGLRDAMRAAKLRNVQQLWEGTGAWGILRLRHDKKLGKSLDFSRRMIIDEEISAEYRRWVVGPQGMLKMVDTIGDPRIELDNRVNILIEGKWINSVVFKNMRWSPESLDRAGLNKEFDDAIFASPKPFHHIILWRKNMFDWLCSRYVLMRVGMAHGIYEWDGTTLIGDKNRWKPAKYKRQAMAVLDEFIETFKIIPKDKTIMLETSVLNSLNKASWPDQTGLSLPPNVFKQQSGSMVYINTATGLRASPKDLLQPFILDMFRELEAEINKKYNWQDLDKNSGFTYYE